MGIWVMTTVDHTKTNHICDVGTWLHYRPGHPKKKPTLKTGEYDENGIPKRRWIYFDIQDSVIKAKLQGKRMEDFKTTDMSKTEFKRADFDAAEPTIKKGDESIKMATIANLERGSK